jgi:hypothetical protein
MLDVVCKSPSLTFTTSEAIGTDNTDTDNVAASTFAPDYAQAGIPTASSTLGYVSTHR